MRDKKKSPRTYSMPHKRKPKTRPLAYRSPRQEGMHTPHSGSGESGGKKLFAGQEAFWHFRWEKCTGNPDDYSIGYTNQPGLHEYAMRPN